MEKEKDIIVEGKLTKENLDEYLKGIPSGYETEPPKTWETIVEANSVSKNYYGESKIAQRKIKLKTLLH